LLVLLLNIYCLLKGDEAEAGCEVGGDCRRGMYKAKKAVFDFFG
jgi:hypothetical protein